jgi:transposase
VIVFQHPVYWYNTTPLFKQWQDTVLTLDWAFTMDGSPSQLAGKKAVVAVTAGVPADRLAHRFGNAADQPECRPRYGSDMSDAEWALLRDLLPVPGWLAGRGGRPEGYCQRQMIDAVRYLVDNGIKWRAMPSDFPPWPRVYAFFARWRDTRLAAELHDRLRESVRRTEGRHQEPSAAVVDSQSVKADATVAQASRGFDAGKKVNGRKRATCSPTRSGSSSPCWSHQRPRPAERFVVELVERLVPGYLWALVRTSVPGVGLPPK